MKIVFMGTPVFSVGILDAIVKAGHEVVAVYTQPPRPAGRGKQLRPSPVQSRAEQLGLSVRHPKSLKGAEEQAEFAALGADIAVVVAYGLLLPQAVLDAPARGCINIHASLLPRWRGAAPIHRAIMAGDAQTGISIMQMEAGLDTGPILLIQDIDIRADETTGQLHDRLAKLGATLLIGTLEELEVLRAVPQAAVGVTYASKIAKAEARVDWSRDADIVDRTICGLSPFPGAWCDMNGERVKLLGSELADGVGEPGQVLGGLTIACGRGAIRITKAQRQGKQAMLAEDFLKGFKMPARLSQAAHPKTLPFAGG